MARVPRSLRRLDVPDGAHRTLYELYDDEGVDDETVRAWEEGKPAALPPFVWRPVANSNAVIRETLGRSRSAVFNDLAALRDKGVIRDAERDGREGLELLGTRPAGSTPTDRKSTRMDSESEFTDAESTPMDSPSPPPRTASPRPRTDSPRARTPSPRTRTQVIEGTRVRPAINQDLREHQAQREQGRDVQPQVTADVVELAGWRGREKDVEIKKPAQPAVDRRSLIDLANEIGGFFCPTTAEGVELRSRRIWPTDVVLGFLQQLVALHGADVVREYCRDYAAICKSNGLEAKWWGPDMLSPIPRKAGGKSAWQMLCVRVDERRAANDASTKQQRDADARVARDKAFAESCAPSPSADTLSADEVKARADAWRNSQSTSSEQQPQQLGLRGVISRVATRGRPPPREEPCVERTAEDEEHMRWQGRAREHQQIRAESSDLEKRRAMLRRMGEAMQLAEAQGRRLTDDEIRLLREGTGT